MSRILLFLLLTAAPVAHAAMSAGALVLAAESVADAGAAARAAAARTGGRVLDVQPRQSGGRAVYDVKVLLDDGRVRIIQFDGPGRSGARDGRD